MNKPTAIAVAVLQLVWLFAGGLASVIANACGYREANLNGIPVYSVVVLVLVVLVVIIEVASALKIHGSTVHTVFTACSLLINYLFSPDMQDIVNPSGSGIFAYVSECICYMSFLLLMLTHLYLINYIYHFGIKKIEAGILSGYSAMCVAGYVPLGLLGMQYIAYIAYDPVLIYIFAKIFLCMKKNRNYDWTFVLIVSIMFAAAGMQFNAFLYCAGAFGYWLYGITATYVLLIVFLYAMVYACFLLNTERAALQASEYKLQAERMRTKMLREQINPHFIFNSLITVKEAYHCDSERGDMAMNYFSRHLRANVEAMNTDCIPLGDELDNVETYIGLENMRRGKPVNIFYDIEDEGVKLPVLSLQVFVENAVRYAGTEEKEDGFIAISSYKCDGGTAVEVTDNGVGFDQTAVKKTSCGINNARERFKLLLNADITIESGEGKGTKVRIFIPDGGKGGCYEDNNS